MTKHFKQRLRGRPRGARGLWLLASALLLSACSEPSSGPAGGRSATPVEVVTVKAVEQDWVDRIEALGTARANESLTITAKVTETVARVNFSDGDLVTEGQLLVDLSGRAEVAGLEEAQANYTEALQQYRRQVELVEAGTIARSQLDSLVATRDAAKARMDATRARLADRVIVAPFAGLLGFRQVSPGTLVTPGTPIATLDDVSLIKLDFSIPERFLSAVASGQSISARSAAWPGREFVGTVSNVGSRVDPVTRAVTLRAEIANPDRELRPGMLLTVELMLPPRPATVIPELALIQVGTQQSVFLVDEAGAVTQQPVRSGARRRGEVEIIEGLEVGQRVVVEGLVKLRPGMRVVEAAAAAPPVAAGTAAAAL
jgi:membrane fusion protein (multidrug efflux system)